MTQLHAVSLEIGDMLHHHQAGRRPVEVKCQSVETDDVERLVVVIVFDAGGDQHVFAVEAVSRRRDDVFLNLPNAGMRWIDYLDRFREHLVAIDAPAAGLEPSLGVEHRPAAAGQYFLADTDFGQAFTGDDKFDAARRSVMQSIGADRPRAKDRGPTNRCGNGHSEDCKRYPIPERFQSYHGANHPKIDSFNPEPAATVPSAVAAGSGLNEQTQMSPPVRQSVSLASTAVADDRTDHRGTELVALSAAILALGAGAGGETR